MYKQIEESTEEYLKQRRKGRLTFIAIGLLFLGPFILAALAHKLGWAPEGENTNRGDLVNATQAVLETPLAIDERDEMIELRKKWSLLLFVPSPCDEACKVDVDQFEVIHFRLNRDIERVQIVSVNSQDIIKSPFARKISAGASANALLESFAALDIKTEGVYVIDPRGFVVSHYAWDSDPQDLQKDLKRLLKYSKVG